MRSYGPTRRRSVMKAIRSAQVQAISNPPTVGAWSEVAQPRMRGTLKEGDVVRLVRAETGFDDVIDVGQIGILLEDENPLATFMLFPEAPTQRAARPMNTPPLPAGHAMVDPDNVEPVGVLAGLAWKQEHGL